MTSENAQRLETLNAIIHKEQKCHWNTGIKPDLLETGKPCSAAWPRVAAASPFLGPARSCQSGLGHAVHAALMGSESSQAPCGTTPAEAGDMCITCRHRAEHKLRCTPAALQRVLPSLCYWKPGRIVHPGHPLHHYRTVFL